MKHFADFAQHIILSWTYVSAPCAILFWIKIFVKLKKRNLSNPTYLAGSYQYLNLNGKLFKLVAWRSVF